MGEWGIFTKSIEIASILLIVLFLSTFLRVCAVEPGGLWDRWRRVWAYGERAALASLSPRFCLLRLFSWESWLAEICLIQ